MRVDYTLPALQPALLPDAPSPQDAGRSFRDQLRATSLRLPGEWVQQLRLDARPFTAAYIGPPPRPRTLELNDAESERSRWRNMLWRHGSSPGARQDLGPSEGSVGLMLEMLLEMQHMEDSIVSQSVALTRG
jgi:hypothetical protein